MTAPPRAKHRAPARRRGWAPRALLSAATVPAGIVAGLAVALGSVALDRPALAWLGVLVAGAPGVYQAVRAVALEAELRSVLRPSAPTVAGTPEVASAPVVASRPAVVTPAAPGPDVDLAPRPATSERRLIEGRIDTGELQRIWDLGEAPDTGPQPVVVAVEPRVLLGAGQVRAGVAEDRVYDALAVAEADEMTRALELPSRRGRHAAPAPLDHVLHPPRPATSPRRGRHAA